MSQKAAKNIETVRAVLQDEVKGDVRAALKKLDDAYTMTWVYKAPKSDTLFPTTQKSIEDELEEVYHIKDRRYDIKHMVADDDVVFVEMIESYSDPETKQVYRTPLVLVLEMKEGKIKTGRHYCDPALSYMNLSEEEVRKAFK